jgi:hypothetical protein
MTGKGKWQHVSLESRWGDWECCDGARDHGWIDQLAFFFSFFMMPSDLPAFAKRQRHFWFRLHSVRCVDRQSGHRHQTG